MADVSRPEFDALASRVTALEAKLGTPAKPKPEPDPTLTLQPVAATVDGASYTLTATAVAGSTVTAKYLQIAVRTPSGGLDDIGHRPASTLRAGQAVQVTGTDTATAPGTYTTWLACSLDGQKWTDGPKSTFTIAAIPETPRRVPADGRRLPVVGKSKLPFNSVVFRGGSNVGDAEAFGRWRGTPVDGYMWFTARRSWADFREHWAGKRDWLESGRILITTISHAPTSEDNAMNERGANNAYRDQQRALGKWMADEGVSHPLHILRVDWEANGNWYPWSANRPGGPEALKQSLINYVDNLRAMGLTKVLFDLCWNKGPSQSGADFSFFPGAEWFDIMGIDQYDQWRPAHNDAEWNAEIRKTPALETLVQQARKHEVMWSIDECGNTHGHQSAGGDNPFYWRKLKEFILENQRDNAFQVTYDHPGAPATLRHDFASNPRSAAVYKQLWTPS